MRVETRIETKTYEVNTYIADDGAEFATVKDCEKYEKQLKEREAEKWLKETDMRVPKLDGVVPLHSDPDDFCSFSDLAWYKVKSEEDVDKIKQMYEDAGHYINFFDCESYPNLFGVENCDGQIYTYTLTKMKNLVKNFFKKNFDIDVEYKGKEEDDEQ